MKTGTGQTDGQEGGGSASPSPPTLDHRGGTEHLSMVNQWLC